MRTMLALLMLAGCSGEDPCVDGDSSLTIGTGETAFEALEGEVLAHFGPQGGYHLFGSLQASGLWDGGNSAVLRGTTPRVQFRATAGDHEAGYGPRARTFDATDSGTIEMVGDLLIWSTNDPEDLDGLDVDIEASVTDNCGVTVSQSWSGTLGIAP
ncbi:MAG: hypothetical protein AB8H79_02655 [Myxococcota bacterium]